MGLYLVREQFQSDMCLVRKSESLINTFLFCLQRMIIWNYGWLVIRKNCRDRENVTLMLYRNIYNIWPKYEIQMSYKN